mmetsp:Transcript_48227/g.114762  ORF Transcript_48227/g.114762 Transcript_48227/m.114762 type:complete len:205 (+) Transcript_48227:163-777(+)
MLVARGRIELHDRLVEALVQLHDRRLVPAAVAIVGRREEGQDPVCVLPLEPLHDELMGAHDELQRVVVVERLRDVLTEGVSGAARRDAPPVPIVRVRPHQVADRPLVGDLDEAVQLLHVLDPVQRRRKAAVGAEDGVVDNRGEGEVVEEVGEALPYVRAAVLADALVVEAVDLGDLARLVVSAQDRDPVRVPELEEHDEGDALD